MKIDRINSILFFNNKSLVRHGSSMLFCLPKAACDWLELDVNSKVDCTVDILNSTLTLKKSEDKNGTRNTNRIEPGRGEETPTTNTTDQAISSATTKADTIVQSQTPVDAGMNSTELTTMEREQESSTQTFTEEHYAPTKEDDRSRDDSTTDRQDSDYQG